jgi:hypothetical protein
VLVVVVVVVVVIGLLLRGGGGGGGVGVEDGRVGVVVVVVVVVGVVGRCERRRRRNGRSGCHCSSADQPSTHPPIHQSSHTNTTQPPRPTHNTTQRNRRENVSKEGRKEGRKEGTPRTCATLRAVMRRRKRRSLKRSTTSEHVSYKTHRTSGVSVFVVLGEEGEGGKVDQYAMLQPTAGRLLHTCIYSHTYTPQPIYPPFVTRKIDGATGTRRVAFVNTHTKCSTNLEEELGVESLEHRRFHLGEVVADQERQQRLIERGVCVYVSVCVCVCM